MQNNSKAESSNLIGSNIHNNINLQSLNSSQNLNHLNRFIPHHLSHSRQRSQMIISQLRKEIQSINHIIDQSKILIYDTQNVNLNRQPYHQNSNLSIPNHYTITTPRNNQQGQLNQKQFPIYVDSESKYNFNATTRMKPKINITISCDQSKDQDKKNQNFQNHLYNSNKKINNYSFENRSPYSSIKKQAVIHNSQHDTHNRVNCQICSRLDSKYPVSKVINQRNELAKKFRNQQLQEVRRKQLLMEKKTVEIQSLLQRSRIQNQHLKDQIKDLQIKSILQNKNLKLKLSSLQRAMDDHIQQSQRKKQKIQNNMKNITKHRKTMSNFENKTQKKQHNVAFKAEPAYKTKAFPYLQKHTGSYSRYFPYNQYRSKSKSNIKYHSPIKNLGSIELSKQQKEKILSKQEITFKDNHPYLTKHLLEKNRKLQYTTYNRNKSFDYSLGKINNKSQNKCSNQKANKLASKLIDSKSRKMKGLTVVNKNQNRNNFIYKQLQNKRQNESYLGSSQKVDYATNYPYRALTQSSSFKYKPSHHNCQVGLKTTFQQIILPEKAPTRQQFKDAVLKHYIVGYYLNDDDLNDLYARVAHGNVPSYQWPVIAMEAAYQKVHNSNQRPRVIY